MKTNSLREKRDRLRKRKLFALVLTMVAVATNVMNAAPDNPLSMEMRQALGNALPVDFVRELNLELSDYELPALPSPESVESNIDPLEALADIVAPPPTSTPEPAITELPVVSSTPKPTAAPTLEPTPTMFVSQESRVDMARQWILYDDNGGNPITFNIENQDGIYVVASIESETAPVELADQSWDGEKLTWKYIADDGNGGKTLFSVETVELNVCGCGGLGYLLVVNFTTGPDGFQGTEPVYEASLVGITELVPDADYSGNWKIVWHSNETGEKTFEFITIQKVAGNYIVSSLQEVISQSWDGEVLEWQYRNDWGNITTMKTIGMDKAGILVVSRHVETWDENYYEETGLFLASESGLNSAPVGAGVSEPKFSPEPQRIEFQAEDGTALVGYYYPAAVDPAPVLVLMPWSRGTHCDWVFVNLVQWAQNRGLPDGLAANPACANAPINIPTPLAEFPPLPPEQSYAVFAFDYRGFGESGGSADWNPSGYLQDSIAAMNTARALEGVDPMRVAAIGASIGADGAVSACGEGCLGTLLFSPGNYLPKPFADEATRLSAEQKPTWCVVSSRDGESYPVCNGASGDSFQEFTYKKGGHGLSLFQEGLEPQVTQVIFDFLQAAFGD